MHMILLACRVLKWITTLKWKWSQPISKSSLSTTWHLKNPSCRWVVLSDFHLCLSLLIKHQGLCEGLDMIREGWDTEVILELLHCSNPSEDPHPTSPWVYLHPSDSSPLLRCHEAMHHFEVILPMCNFTLGCTQVECVRASINLNTASISLPV